MFFVNTFRILTVAALVVVSGSVSRANASDPIDIPPVLLKHRFAQTSLGSCTNELSQSALPNVIAGRFRIGHQPTGAITIASNDQNGIPWNLTLTDGSDECSAWLSDLDSNGQQDLIILTKYSNSEATYGLLTIILVDDLGRPVPWHATGLFDADERGVRELIDLDQNGRAEVLNVYREGNRFDGVRYSLSLYQISDSNIKKVNGTKAGISFPLLLNASDTFRKRQQAVDLSAARPINTASLQVVSFDTKQGEILLSDQSKVRLPETIIAQFTDGATFGTVGLTDALLTKIKDQKLFVTFIGNTCEEEECRPLTMWATAGK